MKYLTLGYGTAWGGRGPQSGDKSPSSQVKDQAEPSPGPAMRFVEPEPDVDRVEERLKRQVQQENAGYFIIGLKGSMEDDGHDDGHDDENEDGDWNNRIPLRTVHVELADEAPETPGSERERYAYEENIFPKAVAEKRLSRLQPVIYVVRYLQLKPCEVADAYL